SPTPAATPGAGWEGEGTGIAPPCSGRFSITMAQSYRQEDSKVHRSPRLRPCRHRPDSRSIQPSPSVRPPNEGNRWHFHAFPPRTPAAHPCSRPLCLRSPTMGLDVVLLSRLQFALTIMFHYLFPPLTIGMGLVLVYLEGMHL